MYYNIILSLDHLEIIYWYCLLLEIIRAAKWTVCPINRTKFVGNTNRYHWTPSSLFVEEIGLRSHYIPESFLRHQEKLSGMVWTAMAWRGTSHSHTSNIMLLQLLAKTVYFILFSLLNIYFHLRGLQSSLYQSIHKTYLMTNM